MPFALNPAVGTTLATLAGDNPPPPAAVGDVQTRRERVLGLFTFLASLQTPATDVDQKDFYTKASDGHEILLRWYTKQGTKIPGSAILYAHGGGMIAGSVDIYDRLVKKYVSHSGVPFLAVDYRLAPEHPAPIPVTDSYAGLQYFHAHASELGVDPHRIGIMGDSGGGGVAASLAHYAKMQSGPSIAKQILIYPMLDDRNTDIDPELAPFAVWSPDDNKTGWGALLGDKLGQDGVPPHHAAGRMTQDEAKGLPDAYIDVGELDIFRDEDVEYARKLGKAGVSCELHVLPGVPHAFEGLAPDSEVAKVTYEARIKAIMSV